MRFEGVIVPAVTPLTAEGKLDNGVFVRLLRRMVESEVGGIFVAGTAGLGPWLPSDVLDEALRVAREIVGDAVPLLGGAMESSTPRTIERLGRLRDFGYKCFVCAAPYYLKPAGEEGLAAHFAACAAAFPDMEMGVYNIPGCVGYGIPLSLLGHMMKVLPIKLVKDSGGDAAYFSALCRLGAEAGVPVFQGLRPDFRSLVHDGASGCVPVTGNLFPELLAKLWRRAEEDDFDAAGQALADRAWETLVAPGDFLSGTLYGMSLRGEGTGVAPISLPSPPEERERAIAKLMNLI